MSNWKEKRKERQHQKHEYLCKICNNPFTITQSGIDSRIKKYGSFEPICTSCLTGHADREIVMRFPCSECGVEVNLTQNGVNNRIKKYGEVTTLCRSCLQSKNNPMTSEKGKEYVEKIKATTKERYGVENIFQDVERIQNSYKAKWGVDNPMKVNEIKEKNFDSNRSNHNGELYWESREAVEKREKVCLEKYGVTNPMLDEEIKKRNYDSNVANHGGVYSAYDPAVREKTQQTNLAKYGYKNVGQIPNFIEKMKATQKAKYNGVMAAQAHLPERTREILFNKDKLEEYLKENEDKSCLSLEKDLGTTWATIRSYIYKYDLYYLRTKARSSFEEEVCFFLDSLNIPYQHTVKLKNGKEIDILIPDFNLGVECDGNYWHTEEKGKTKYYHIDKSNTAKEEGIDLIHIFEIDWYRNSDVIKNFLKKKLNKLENVISVEDIELLDIEDLEVVNSFIKDNSMKYIPPFTEEDSIENIGVIKDNDLIALISFIRGDSSISVVNYCELIGYNLEGIFDFITDFLVDKYNLPIIINRDKRYFNKELLKNFNFINSTEPQEWYWNYKNDHLLKENDFKDEYMKIYDCGQNVYIKEVKSC